MTSPVEAISFSTRARTVDHLGREQIADCPTAVSELWKNAWDAYAREVALHVFDGEVPVAAVVDDGHGMSRQEFVDKWLVLGTEAKVGHDKVAQTNRLGLAPRIRQGQKGIGRLSAAFLGPVCLVVSKRVSSPFCAALVDWRVFQNPHLQLSDVGIPVAEFDDQAELLSIIPKLVDSLVDNIWSTASDKNKRERVEQAWALHDRESIALGLSAPSRQLVSSALNIDLTARHLASWGSWAMDVAKCHGTAMFVFGAGNELTAWLNPNETDAEPQASKTLLTSTLAGFLDPYATDSIEFDYRVIIHVGENARLVVSKDQLMSMSQLRQLEHVIEGFFDEHGTFNGTVTAFGKKQKPFVFKSARSVPASGVGYVGPVQFCIATFEQNANKSIHDDEHHALLMRKVEKYGGLGIYRDSLRVLPYGRPDADYFGIEERRSLHAGREFWSHRRCFGRLSIARLENPNLRDKAGREGLIDNKARRELRALVVDLLQHTARKYFGSDSELRVDAKKFAQARSKREVAAKAAEEKAQRSQFSRFRHAVRSALPLVRSGVSRSSELDAELTKLSSKFDAKRWAALGEGIFSLQDLLASSELPVVPSKLGNVEKDYRAFRDHRAELRTNVEQLVDRYAAGGGQSKPSPADLAANEIAKHESALHVRAKQWSVELSANPTARLS